MGAERNDGLLEIGIAYAGHGQQQVSGIKGGHIHSAKNIGVRGLGPTMLGGSPAIRHKRARHIFYATATVGRSEEHTSELQSLMRISYAVFCLKKKKKKSTQIQLTIHTNKRIQ